MCRVGYVPSLLCAELTRHQAEYGDGSGIDMWDGRSQV